MRRLVCGLVLVCALAGFAAAQDEPSKAGHSSEAAAQEKPMLGWLWANFIILALGLGYLASKHVPPLLRTRSEEIRKGIEEAGRLKAESEARLAEMERRLGGLASDIDKLRIQLISEMNLEGQRMRDEAEHLVTRIHQQAEQEIQFMTKLGRQQLKEFSAKLAVDLAGQRIEQRMNPQIQHRLVDGFLSHLRESGERGVRAQ